MPRKPAMIPAHDRYARDPLASYSRRPVAREMRAVEAAVDLVVEHDASQFCGAILRAAGGMVELEDFARRVRVFPLTDVFLIDGEPVRLVRPQTKSQGMLRSASGSVAVKDSRARVARESRIFVEGRHDAELVEKVWGHDLRIDGVVVEYLGGVDDLAAAIAKAQPTATRRIGVLVDHLVPGSKESRIAETVSRGASGANVLVVGHPFVDVWQAVKPARLGLSAWPEIPRSVEWKHGVCEALGWPHESVTDVAEAWQRILVRVTTYADLEPVLLARVEQLIDFVTSPPE